MTAPSRETLRRLAFEHGGGRSIVTGPMAIDDAAPTTSGQQVDVASGASRVTRTMPVGAHEHLAAMRFGAHGVAATDEESAHRVGYMLATTFGLLRHEPENPYNDHRAVASVRSKFPVHGFLDDGATAWHVDSDSHALVAMSASSPAPISHGPLRVILAARPTDLPTFYDQLRSPLVGLEFGITLRQLLIAGELWGVPLRVAQGVPESSRRRLGLPGDRWAAGIGIDVGDLAKEDAVDGQPPAALAGSLNGSDAGPDDARLAVVIGAHATHGDLPAAPGAAQPPVRPGAAPVTGSSWAEVFWRRSSGRMAVGLHGLAFRPCRLEPDERQRLADWANVTPPGPALQALWQQMTVTAVFNDGADAPANIDVLGDQGMARAVHGAFETIEHSWGYPTAPGNGGRISTAAACLFWSIDLADALDAIGPAAYTLAHRAAGWSAHGVCLAAASLGLAARPALSFDEVVINDLLGSDLHTSVLLGVVVGRDAYAAPLVDLRV